MYIGIVDRFAFHPVPPSGPPVPYTVPVMPVFCSCFATFFRSVTMNPLDQILAIQHELLRVQHHVLRVSATVHALSLVLQQASDDTPNAQPDPQQDFNRLIFDLSRQRAARRVAPVEAIARPSWQHRVRIRL
eukprot:scaffold310170_cov75-Attheya_sp.AAC.3